MMNVRIPLEKEVMEIIKDPDVAAIQGLLREAELPISDVSERAADNSPVTFFGVAASQTPDYSEGSSRLAGVIGVEIYDGVALLRSLAVCPEYLGRGLGSLLVAHLERFVHLSGVVSLYLLTTTAEAYFEHRGYEIISRSHVPSSIKKTEEFSSICPESAVVMVKHS